MTVKEHLDILFKPDYLCTYQESLIQQEYEEWKKQHCIGVVTYGRK